MQGAQLAQIILILPVVLRIGVVVCFALLLQLGVVVRELVVVLLLGILFAVVQLIQLAHQLVAAAGIRIQCQTVQRGDGAAQRTDLLLIRLLGGARGIAGAITAGQGCSLRRSICAGIVGVLQIVLLVLAVERILGVAVLEALTLQQLVQKLVDPLLIAALIIARAVCLPLLQRICGIRHGLAGLVAGICQRVFHLRAAVQSRCRIAALHGRLAAALRLRLHNGKRFFLFLSVCHI